MLAITAMIAISPLIVSFHADAANGAADGVPPVWSGSGTEKDPYLINNTAELAKLATDVNKGNLFTNVYFLMTTDIDLGVAPYNAGWTPIGNSYGLNFNGIFDGGSHVIQNLKVTGTNSCVGLFGYVGTGGIVKNVGVGKNSTVGGGTNVGGVVGYNIGTVTNCYNTGSVGGNSNYVGGVVGYGNGTVTNCYNTGSVSGGYYVGGVAGISFKTITNCYNTGSVSGGNYVGGVAGWSSGTFTNCYNTGSVSGGNYVGGVAGLIYSGTFANCYNTGSVSGSVEVGGVVGENNSTVTNCYNTGSVGGRSYIGGVVGYNYNKVTNCYYNTDNYTGPNNSLGKGLTTAQMAADDVLTGSMSGLGSAFEKRASDNFLYYPELSVFKNNAVPAVQEASRVSAIAGKAPAMWSGSGTEKDPYLINNANDLAMLSTAVNGGNAFTGVYFLMTTNINLGVAPYNAGWTPIGNVNNIFNGIFNGGNHVIQSLTVKGPNNYAGLFGRVGTSGGVESLGIDENSSVSGNNFVGSVAGANGGMVTNCYNTGTVSDGISVGGVVGFNYAGTVTNCYNTGSVRGFLDAGGVAGYNYGAVTNCYNTGPVSDISFEPGNYVGGAVGYNAGTVTNCYNTGSVSGNSSTNIGGVAGISYGTITNCYYNTDNYTGTNNDLGKGLTTTQMAANDVLAGSMSGLGSAFEKRANIGHLYYPELSVFKNNTDPTVQEASRISVIAGISPVAWSGSGTETDPYLINNADDLARLSAEVSGGNAFTGVYFLMTADINLGAAPYNAGWTPIGNVNNIFDGIFNGGSHVVQSLTVKGPNDYVGLFGNVGTSGVVKDLGIDENSSVSGYNYTCGVVGVNYGSVTNCYNLGSVSGNLGVGGVVGWNYGSVTNCYNTGSVSGNGSVGGVVGTNSGTITNCFNMGSVSGIGSVGGVVGVNYGMITNCYNTGSVGSTSIAGGVVGWNFGTVASCYNTGSVSNSGSNGAGGVVGLNYGTITNCYNTGSVSGVDHVGGVAGYNSDTVTNCYNTGLVSGSYEVGGVVGENTGTVTNCYNANSVRCNSNVGGVIGNNNNGTAEMCYYNKDNYAGPDNGIGKGLTTAQMTADDVLTGSMSGLGSAFEKRANDNYLYYPELSVFKNNADPNVQEMSKVSAIAGDNWIVCI